MDHIIQFMHPGKEVDVKKLSKNNGWNIYGHARRLIKHVGVYVDSNNIVKEGELAFWNEYEAPTTPTRIPRSGRYNWKFAKYEHEILPLTKQMANPFKDKGSCCANTDPCVFGDTFKYSNCQQIPQGDLWKLNSGDVVLFGAHHKNLFALDTVFVVRDRGIVYQVPIRTFPLPSAISVSSEYKILTLDNLGPRKNRRAKKNHAKQFIDQFVFYRGVPVLKGDLLERGQIFSYTPAKLAGTPDYNERCMIDLRVLNGRLRKAGLNAGFARKLKQGHKAIVYSGGQVSVNLVWNEVRDMVEKVNMKNPFVLGTHFDWPVKLLGSVKSVISSSKGA